MAFICFIDKSNEKTVACLFLAYFGQNGAQWRSISLVTLVIPSLVLVFFHQIYSEYHKMSPVTVAAQSNVTTDELPRIRSGVLIFFFFLIETLDFLINCRGGWG